ncbi:hypothetical protein ABEB36_009509 [Hypothenemus hampei]|uniref:HTH CENPB-type domain-containing protein n=1 Tax=Hypothenemus hampei TaxID=57062 RepID=A0ABD1EIR2_HYPHA
MEALEKRLPIHDMDIRKWALEANQNVGLDHTAFKAFDTWIKTFKRHHRIVSRKITKFITKKNLLEQDVIIKKPKEFVEAIKKKWILMEMTTYSYITLTKADLI